MDVRVSIKPNDGENELTNPQRRRLRQLLAETVNTFLSDRQAFDYSVTIEDEADLRDAFNRAEDDAINRRLRDRLPEGVLLSRKESAVKRAASHLGVPLLVMPMATAAEGLPFGAGAFASACDLNTYLFNAVGHNDQAQLLVVHSELTEHDVRAILAHGYGALRSITTAQPVPINVVHVTGSGRVIEIDNIVPTASKPEDLSFTDVQVNRLRDLAAEARTRSTWCMNEGVELLEVKRAGLVDSLAIACRWNRFEQINYLLKLLQDDKWITERLHGIIGDYMDHVAADGQ